MSPEQQADVRRYASAWTTLLQMVRDGRSWSGGERNRCLLNVQDGSFADVSFAAGLDHPGDGRGLAVVDWDQDGDLDLWYRNRTAPRLRLMSNQHEPGKGKRDDFLALRLEGTSCNRDAIGAMVEVMVPGAKGRLVRSLKAGDLFLSQSSKWLHIGLGANAAVSSAYVRWPGGAREEFSGLEAGGAFLLKQGLGTASRIERSARKIPSGVLSVPPPGAGSAQVNLPAKIPLPPLAYQGPGGERRFVAGQGAAQLVILWSEGCPRCERELADVVAAAGQYRVTGLPLIAALNVDGPQGRAKAAEMITALRWPFEWGILEEESLRHIGEFQRALFDVTVPLNLPAAFLLGGDGEVMGIYRGSLEVDRVGADLKALRMADEEERHAFAPPLAGRWFTKPVDPVYALEFMAEYFEQRLPEEALYYFGAAYEQASGKRRVSLGVEVAQRHHRAALRYKERRQPERAEMHFRRAIELGARAEYLLDYGTMLASYGSLDAAAEVLLEALELEPGLKPAQRALAMVRKLQAEGN